MNPFLGLGSLSPTEFVTKYWDRQPYRAIGVADASLLNLTVQRICDEYIAQGEMGDGFTSYNAENTSRQQGRDAVTSLWKNGQPPTIQQLSEFNHRSALIIRGAQRYFPELAAALMPWNAFFNCRINANVYLTRAGSSAFATHHDQHHVFTVQVDGEKDWFIWPPVVDAPHGRYQFEEVRAQGNSLEWRASRGDLIYLPLGWLHHAKTVREYSVHITIGVNPPRWIDLIEQAVDQAAGQYSLLRRALPLRFSPSCGMEFFADSDRHIAPILMLLIKDMPRRMLSILEQSGNIVDDHFSH